MIHDNIKLIIFDADKTLRCAKSNPIAPSTADDWRFLPGVEDWFRANRKRYHIGFASNQGGVEKGYVSHDVALSALVSMAQQLGILDMAAVRMCEHYAEHPRRKPNAGMLVELMDYFSVSPQDTLMVGDMKSDEQAAANAGCCYMHPRELFLW
jgi:D-glycero-D-manno-heptose 1,7-bisphosphate phosphatase